jgi:hypothetical protein
VGLGSLTIPKGISRIYQTNIFLFPVFRRKDFIDMEKIAYVEPELELVVLSDEDIVITSGGIDLPIWTFPPDDD